MFEITMRDGTIEEVDAIIYDFKERWVVFKQYQKNKKTGLNDWLKEPLFVCAYPFDLVKKVEVKQ